MSEKPPLLKDSSDSEVELTINKDYANRYDSWRHKEELQKYKDLKKDEEDSESSSEIEDENPDESDEEFFRAISLLKGNDLQLSDKNFHLFQEKERIIKAKESKPKPIYMKDYERNLVLERGGKFSDEDDENLPEKVPTYNEEQENLKKSFQEAAAGSDDSDYDDLLHVRIKTKKEEDDAEADYVKWVKGEEKNVPENVKKDMSHLRNYYNDPKLGKSEKFLNDYFLSKGYLEKDDSEIPTFKEITGNDSSDSTNEEHTKFERNYNFRFEEPDEEYIKRYPRIVVDSLRRVDNRRKQKREEKTDRKRKEREQRREELKRLKALKRKEIEEKFMKLKEISGQDEINLDESDIESDFDPDKHDKKMREIFNDEYYQVEEDKKPEFPYDDELDSENWNAWTGEKSLEGKDQESEEEEIDTASNSHESNESKLSAKDDFANEMINASRPKRKAKKKSIFAKIISHPKPIYDPSGKSFEDYLDEYYKLDYEDVIGDMPVRYKYRKVIPNDFGLTVDEILAADDRELNRWCSVKKTCQYRNDDEELYDVQAFQKKAGNPLAKKKFLPSVYAPKNDNSLEDVNSNAKEKKTLNVKDGAIDSPSNKIDDQEDLEQEMSEKTQTANQDFDSSMHVNVSSKKSKKKKRKSSLSENKAEPTNFNQSNVSDLNNCKLDSNGEIDKDILEAQEESKKSKKEKQKVKMVRDSGTLVTESCTSVDDSTKPTKRKRKHIENPVSDSEVDHEVALNDLSPKSKQNDTSDFNIVTESNSNLVPENSSETPLKKKRKKKKHKRNKSNNNNETTTQGDISNSFHNKFKNKCKKYALEDKRLGLSDERLVAYGINPKKFKNRIIYSKK